jgi:hypothetical protein
MGIYFGNWVLFKIGVWCFGGISMGIYLGNWVGVLPPT